MQNDENESGEYYTLHSETWKLLETDLKTDGRGRIHLNREFAGREPKVFVSDEKLEPETCKNFIILSKSKWFEVRRVRGKGKKEAGEPLEVQTNGDIWTGHKDKFVRVFIKEVKNK